MFKLYYNICYFLSSTISCELLLFDILLYKFVPREIYVDNDKYTIA